MIIQIVKEPFSDLKNFILVDNDFKLKLLLRETVKVKLGSYRTSPLILSWA
jgi:hypothetical protein